MVARRRLRGFGANPSATLGKGERSIAPFVEAWRAQGGLCPMIQVNGVGKQPRQDWLQTGLRRMPMMNDWTMMAGYGIGHWIIFAVTIGVVLYPIGRILNRIGLSPFWSILALIPLVNLIALWVLAFVDWPGRKEGIAD
jgi:hypothetical protein